jgi:acylphosphatase
MPVDEFEKEKKRVLELMATPNVEVARVIYDYLPDLGERFDPERHIAATIDVSGPGVFVFKEVAERANVDVELFDIPLLNPKLSLFAADNYIMPDATAGTNGAVALFLHKRLVDEVLSRLEKIPHLKPMVVGRVLGKGEGRLVVPTLQYISSKKLREKLESPQRVLGGLGKTVEKPGRARVYVAGEVQGVGFRPAVRAKAKALGLNGYAKNLPDGRVEVVLEGDTERIRRLVEELCKGFNCRVEEVTWEPYTGQFNDFEIL